MIYFSEYFKSKRVVVTGAAGVYGYWIAKAFIEAGADLLLTDNNPGRLASVGAAIGDGNQLQFVADLTSDSDIAALPV